MTRRSLFGALVGVLGVVLYQKPPINGPPPPVLLREPDQTLHQQIFS